MRRMLIFAIALAVGCSTDNPAAPSASHGKPSVSSILISGPEAIRVSDSVRLSVLLLDEAANLLSDRPVTFASSDLRLATIDDSGLIRALAEGFVTISASSESVRAQKILRIIPPLGCSSATQDCVATEERYVLVRVNGQPLPVKSPWGVGEWDYDADAGTWKVTNAEMILSAGGKYSYMTYHRAASGATSSYSFRGTYDVAVGTVIFYPNGGSFSSAILTATGLVERWADGRTLEYVRSASTFLR